MVRVRCVRRAGQVTGRNVRNPEPASRNGVEDENAIGGPVKDKWPSPVTEQKVGARGKGEVCALRVRKASGNAAAQNDNENRI